MTQPLPEPSQRPDADLVEAYEPDQPPYESFDLEDRQALRRVPGLATELEDVTEVEYRQLRLERVVLVGVWTSGTVTDAENSMAELARLARPPAPRCSTSSCSAGTGPTRRPTSAPARPRTSATWSSPPVPTPWCATVS
jgi:hypothetical protein